MPLTAFKAMPYVSCGSSLQCFPLNWQLLITFLKYECLECFNIFHKRTGYYGQSIWLAAGILLVFVILYLMSDLQSERFKPYLTNLVACFYFHLLTGKGSHTQPWCWCWEMGVHSKRIETLSQCFPDGIETSDGNSKHIFKAHSCDTWPSGTSEQLCSHSHSSDAHRCNKCCITVANATWNERAHSRICASSA